MNSQRFIMFYRSLYICCFLMVKVAFGQTFTMGNKCYEKSRQASAMLAEKKSSEALALYNEMEGDCKTKDAKELIQAGKAEAYNGLGQHEEAIKASDQALKSSKNRSLNAWFQKSVALNALGRPQEASDAFSHVISLTEKNKDTKARANNYALLANLQRRQLGHKDSAAYYLDKAKSLDPGNVNYMIMEGDWKVADGDYDGAFAIYDQCVAQGKNDLEMYSIRSDARIKMVEDKYGTTNAQELRSKMNEQEKEQVCKELKQAFALGLKDVQKDMFTSLICK